MQGSLGIVFQGSLRTDARVLRETCSFALHFKEVVVFSSSLQFDDVDLVPGNVRLIGFQLANSWWNRNIAYGDQFMHLKQSVLQEQFDYLLCIDYPTLKLGVAVKQQQPTIQLIYDSHEIYIETINQFYPSRGWKSIYGIPLMVLNRWFHNNREQSYVKEVTKCLTVCSSLQCYFEKRWGQEVLLLRNCPSLSYLNGLPLVQKEDRSSFVLIYQGNLNPGRGLHYLLSVMSELPDWFQLWIIGDGMLRDELEGIIRVKKLSNVILYGEVPYRDLLTYTQQADLGISLIEPINLSKEYALPNKLFEYMAAGIPMLSNALPEPVLIKDQYNYGFLTEMSDVQETARIIVEISKDKEFLDVQGQLGRTLIESRLNWETEFSLFLTTLRL